MISSRSVLLTIWERIKPSNIMRGFIFLSLNYHNSNSKIGPSSSLLERESPIQSLNHLVSLSKASRIRHETRDHLHKNGLILTTSVKRPVLRVLIDRTTITSHFDLYFLFIIRNRTVSRPSLTHIPQPASNAFSSAA
jgi:hypothetical protein